MRKQFATKDITDEQVVRCALLWRDVRRASTLTELMEMTGAPEKVCLSAIYRASGRKLVEWGTSATCAWPEPAGLALLRSAATSAGNRHR